MAYRTPRALTAYVHPNSPVAHFDDADAPRDVPIDPDEVHDPSEGEDPPLNWLPGLVLGLCVVWAGIKELQPNLALQQEYDRLHSTWVTQRSVGVLQIVSGLVILYPRTQRLACFGVSALMLYIIIRRVMHGQFDSGVWNAFAFLVAAVGAIFARRP